MTKAVTFPARLLLAVVCLLVSTVTATCHLPPDGNTLNRPDDYLHIATSLACEMMGGTYGPYKERRFSWFDGANCWNYKFYLDDKGSANFDTTACNNWLTTEINGCNHGGENYQKDGNGKRWYYDVFGTYGDCNNPTPSSFVLTSVLRQLHTSLPTALPTCTKS